MPIRHLLTAQSAREELRKLVDPALAASAGRFFKTGPGEYGEGDVFLGLRAPTLRQLAKDVEALPLAEVEKLLASQIHEERSLALFVMVRKAAKAAAPIRKQLYDAYLANVGFVNNWDLVDVSAPTIVGGYLQDKSRQPLVRLAKSKNLWERRIAIVATQHWIRVGDVGDTLTIAELLLSDDEDLIHKAVGWMLREVGDRDRDALVAFLATHYRVMPRTMLQYAIEKFPQEVRQDYLKGRIDEDEVSKTVRRQD